MPGGQRWHLVGSLGPLVAAILVVALERGREGLLRLAIRVVRWPGARIFMVALLGPTIILLAGLFIARLINSEWLDLHRLGTSTEFPDMKAWLYVPAAILFFGFGEEVARWAPACSRVGSAASWSGAPDLDRFRVNPPA